MRILLDAQTKQDVVTITRPLFTGETHTQTFSSEWIQGQQGRSRVSLGTYSAIRPLVRFKDRLGSVDSSFAETINRIEQITPGARAYVAESKMGVLDFQPDSPVENFGALLVLAQTLVQFDTNAPDVSVTKPSIPGRFHNLGVLAPRSVSFATTVRSRHQTYLADLADLLPTNPNGAIFFKYEGDDLPNVLDITADLMTTRYLAVQLALLMAKAVGADSETTELISQRDFAVRAAATECVVLNEFTNAELHLLGEGTYEIAREAVRAIATTAAEVDAFMARHVRALERLADFPDHDLLASTKRKAQGERIVLESPATSAGTNSSGPELIDRADDEADVNEDHSEPRDEETPHTRSRSEPQMTDRSAFEAARTELNKLVGLASVKREVEGLFRWMSFQRDRMREGKGGTSVTMHMVFTGNPGTGKTTVARLIGQLYKSIGMLEKGHTIEVDRAGLVSEFFNATAKKTTEVFNTALDGVLFIDEAYALNAGNVGNSQDYGKEAINTLLPLIDNNRSRICVIVAGYPNEMVKFFEVNPGMQSRFGIEDAKHLLGSGHPGVLHFEDYRPDELLEIFRIFAASDGFEIDDAAVRTLVARYESAYRGRGPTFGNGRFVRNHYQQTLKNLALRHVSGRPTDNVINVTDIAK